MSNLQQSPRTKEKLRENLGLVMDALRKKYGNVDEGTETMIFDALSWTADDVQEQCSKAVPGGCMWPRCNTSRSAIDEADFG